MPHNLVIVESPAKAKTIEKFLGKDFKVMSSYGHIRDLHKKDFSIDTAHGFKPIYEIPTEKKELVKELKEAASEADMVWLASDEDREGEAIAWHLYDALGLTPEKTRRIVFHEITKPAILHAIENPRDIDYNLVDAQQARRVLDRIVGFELSPVLWKKIKPALSAGRVQSVAVRLIVEREKEIATFISEQYYRVVAQMHNACEDKTLFTAELNRRLKDSKAAAKLLETCKETKQYTVGNINIKPLKKSPAPPFTTSTLQQEAARKLGFTVSQTMMVAQKLYESGHITYMRTDSVNLSSLAINTISEEIKTNIGEQYLKVRNYHTISKGAQEAHEAIRPTYISKHDISGTSQEKRLYELIWKRTIASQMADALIEKTTADILIPGHEEKFVATGEVIKFDGFLKVYMETHDDDNTETLGGEAMLPKMKKGDMIVADCITATQRFTQQPPRYTEASLVKKLEELGIGRPSTYAPTISTIQNRDYVEKGEKKGTERKYEVITLKSGEITSTQKTETAGADKGKLIPTDIGMVVNDFLEKYFPQIMDYNFTAKIEHEFDEIADGGVKWNDGISRFYDEFHPNVENVSKLRLEHKVGERQLGIDPKSGQPVSVKIGRFGPLVQIGTADGDSKPQFASLQKGQSVNTITLDEALKLFDLPRTLGEFEGKEVSVGIGRFGPYVKHDGKYVSIPKELAPQQISLDEAIRLIEAKRINEAQKVVKSFPEDPDLEVLNGRYGVYICYKKQNYKIPKGTDATSLTYEACKAIIADEANAPKKKRTNTTSMRRRTSTTTKK